MSTYLLNFRLEFRYALLYYEAYYKNYHFKIYVNMTIISCRNFMLLEQVKQAFFNDQTDGQPAHKWIKLLES